MQAQERKTAQRDQSLDVISVKRNPYLVDYEEQRRLRRAVNEGSCGQARTVRMPAETAGVRDRRPSGAGSGRAAGAKSRRPSGAGSGRAAGAEGRRPSRAGSGRAAGAKSRRPSEARRAGNCGYADGMRGYSLGNAGIRRDISGRSVDIIDIGRGQPRSVQADGRKNPAASKKAAIKRRRKQKLYRRMMLCAWTLCLVMVGWLILLKVGNASETEKDSGVQELSVYEEEIEDTSFSDAQGLPADVFAKHPAWEENFLPVNEYSRPGETLPEVRDIFVHYTANPGTSAAQNRSYFEQQKDMHEASVSAHFIIGYDGEIIQCVPLNEIAYAVQTRNYDSVSIECCYKAADGSFTQETYDSLISLLAWLTDAYGLDTDHILRHYDCGGKKCPIYYTEHEDAWARLKADVAER